MIKTNKFEFHNFLKFLYHFKTCSNTFGFIFYFGKNNIFVYFKLFVYLYQKKKKNFTESK